MDKYQAENLIENARLEERNKCQDVIESLTELVALLEQHTPPWYKMGHYQRAQAALKGVGVQVSQE